MSHDPANTHHAAHHSSSYHSSSNNFSINQASHSLTIVLYVLCDSLLISNSSKNEHSQNERLQSFHILHALSEMLIDEGIPDFIRSKLLLQLVDPKELLGPSSGRCGQLRSLAFSVYSRCRPAFSHLDGARTLTSFGPTAERESKRVNICIIITYSLYSFAIEGTWMVNLMVDKCISKFPCLKYSSTVTFTTVCYKVNEPIMKQ